MNTETIQNASEYHNVGNSYYNLLKAEVSKYRGILTTDLSYTQNDYDSLDNKRMLKEPKVQRNKNVHRIEYKNIDDEPSMKKLLAESSASVTKNLKEVELTYGFSKNFSTRSLSSLMRVFHLHSLYAESLTIHIDNHRCVTDEILLSIIEQLRSTWINLRKISFNFSLNTRFNADALHLLTKKALTRLPKLQDLSLNIHWATTNTKGEDMLTVISRNLKKTYYYANLQKLDLQVAIAYHIPATGVQSLLECLSVGLPNLTHLSLALPSCSSVTDCTLHSLSQIIKIRMPKLLSIKFNFEDSVVTKAGLQSLSHALTYKRSRVLKHLNSY